MRRCLGKNLKIVFLIAHSGVLDIFKRRRGHKRRGARGREKLPLFPPLLTNLRLTYKAVKTSFFLVQWPLLVSNKVND